MRIIMYPGFGVADENRYIDILTSALRTIGHTVEPWRKHFSLQKGDIFHIHWPEIIAEIHDRPYHRLRGFWIQQLFFATIRRVKAQGGRVAWTVHDLTPHDAKLRQSGFLQDFMRRFMSQVDIVLTLTEAGSSQIRAALPGLDHAPIILTRHPHYRGIFSEMTSDLGLREQLGVTAEQTLFSFLGSLRPNKRPELVVAAINQMNPSKFFLLMAGSAKADIASQVTKLADMTPHIRLDLRRIPEMEMRRMYAASDILVFPGTDYFNSGTIYNALSLNLPVVAAFSPANRELQQLVGREWLYLYEGNLTPVVLQEARDQLVQRRLGSVCDLSAFDPLLVARQHIDAYTVTIR